MQGWKEKLLSQAGKEVMIKAMVQSIPTYSMSVFKIPVGLCKDIEAMIRRFWWVKGIQKRSIGSNGVLFVLQRPWEVWVLEIFRNLIMLCLLNRYGGFSTKRIRSLVQSILYLMPRYIQNALLHGGVSYKCEM